MRTVHGYDDTQKVLTREQWEQFNAEQRQGFHEERAADEARYATAERDRANASLRLTKLAGG